MTHIAFKKSDGTMTTLVGAHIQSWTFTGTHLAIWVAHHPVPLYVDAPKDDATWLRRADAALLQATATVDGVSVRTMLGGAEITTDAVSRT